MNARTVSKSFQLGDGKHLEITQQIKPSDGFTLASSDPEVRIGVAFDGKSIDSIVPQKGTFRKVLSLTPTDTLEVSGHFVPRGGSYTVNAVWNGGSYPDRIITQRHMQFQFFWKAGLS